MKDGADVLQYYKQRNKPTCIPVMTQLKERDGPVTRMRLKQTMHDKYKDIIISNKISL